MATNEQPISRPEERTGPSATGQAERPGIGDRVRQRINTQVDAQKDRAADGLMSVAGAVRRMGEPLQGQAYEPAVKYVEGAADRVEQAAQYLREHDVDELVDDLRSVARRQPAVFVGVGFLAGAICGRFLKSSNREHAPRGARAENLRSNRRI